MLGYEERTIRENPLKDAVGGSAGTIVGSLFLGRGRLVLGESYLQLVQSMAGCMVYQGKRRLVAFFQ